MASSACFIASMVLTGLEKRYRGFVLGPLSSTIPTGVTALLGANGAGKTTLMRLLVGTVRPSAGSIQFAAPEERVGFLPQEFVGPARATARDYLTFIAWTRSTRRSPISAGHVTDALDAVGLIDRADDRIGRLSGGMVRRLGIAQALLGDVSVLVLDEPTVGLDPVQRHGVRELIAALGSRATVLMSTHLSEDVAAVADNLMVLDSGRMLYEGTAEGLSGDAPVTSRALEAGFLALVGGDVKASGRE